MDTLGTLEEMTNKILHCDALELLRALPDNSIDMVLCDLPYGVIDNSWDKIIPIAPMWDELRRVLTSFGTCVLTATEPFATDLRNGARDLYKYDYIWLKTHRPTGFIHAKNMPISAYENVIVFSKGIIAHVGAANRMTYNPQKSAPTGVVKQRKQNKNTQMGTIVGHRPSHKDYVSIDDGSRYPSDILQFSFLEGEEKLGHTSQKPIRLFEFLVATYSKENEIILDMTCGSGTTAIAANNLNRRFICSDIMPEYVKMARNRLARTSGATYELKDGTKQLGMFE